MINDDWGLIVNIVDKDTLKSIYIYEPPNMNISNTEFKDIKKRRRSVTLSK